MSHVTVARERCIYRPPGRDGRERTGMQKQAPTPLRILFMAGFALSCFGLLLFLWLSFGGNVPLKPKGYRFQVGLPGGHAARVQADVRVSGVSVGKVVDKHGRPAGNRTSRRSRCSASSRRSRCAGDPAPEDAVRETYVELTPGSTGAPRCRRGAGSRTRRPGDSPAGRDLQRVGSADAQGVPDLAAEPGAARSAAAARTSTTCSGTCRGSRATPPTSSAVLDVSGPTCAARSRTRG